MFSISIVNVVNAYSNVGIVVKQEFDKKSDANKYAKNLIKEYDLKKAWYEFVNFDKNIELYKNY